MKVLICISLAMLSVGAIPDSLPPTLNKMVKIMDDDNTPEVAPSEKAGMEMHDEYAEEMDTFVEDDQVLADEAEELIPSEIGRLMTYSLEEIPASDSAPDIRNQEEFQICPGKCGGGNHFRNQTLHPGAVLVEPKEMPWVVSIKRYLSKIGEEKQETAVLCAGTIINSRHILSAASCFKEFEGLYDVGAYITTADLGDAETFETQQEIYVDAIIRPLEKKMKNMTGEIDGHPKYDIMLLRLEEDIKLGPDATPVCLAPPLDYDRVAATSVNFAKYNKYGYSLIKSDVVAMNREHCSEQTSVNFEDHTLCGLFSYMTSISTFPGGPLMVAISGGNYQVGVATSSTLVKLTQQNEVARVEMKKYTSVPYFKAYLAEHITGGTCE